MLRYFYLLGIFYCINSTFCYDYTNDDVPQRARQDVHHGAGYERRKFRTHMSNMHGKHQRYPLRDSEQVAQFNVADFMQGNDNNVEANLRRADKTRKEYKRRNSKDYNNYENFENLFNLNVNDKMAESWADSLEEDQNNILEAASTFKALTDSVNDNNVDYSFAIVDDTTKKVIENNSYPSKSMYDLNFFSRSPSVHYHEKKGVLKNIRIPFFSRNKSNSFIPTKDTKRMTSKNLKERREKRVKESKSVSEGNGQEINDDKDNLYIPHTPSDSFNKNKRSYIEKLCPECKKKYVSNTKAVLRNGETAYKMIHNSRQFMNQPRRNKDKKDTVSLPDNGRERRQYLEEKERQLKELEEVARKVESVHVKPATTRKLSPRVY